MEIQIFHHAKNNVKKKSSKNKPTTWGPKSVKLLYSIMI